MAATTTVMDISKDSTLDMKNSVEIPLRDDEEGTKPAPQPRKIPWTLIPWGVLKTPRSLLKMAQVLLGLIFIALIHGLVRNALNKNFPDCVLLFVTYNVTLLTLVVLIDSTVKSQPLRATFTPQLWDRVEIWYSGLLVLVFHLLAFRCAILGNQIHFSRAQAFLTVLFGFATAAAYLADWWRMFRVRKGENLPPTTSSSFEKIVIGPA